MNPPVPTSNQAHDVDNETIINLLKLAHARSQKLAETWVPYTKEELQDRQNEQHARASQRAEEKLLFRPEHAGLGAETLQSNAADPQGMRTSTFPGSELDKLRKQLLGNKAAAKAAASKTPSKLNHGNKGQKILEASVREPQDESEDEEGRSSLFSSRANKDNLSLRLGSAAPEEEGEQHINSCSRADPGTQVSDITEKGRPLPAPAKRKQSILDQAIADKAKKKKKRNKK